LLSSFFGADIKLRYLEFLEAPCVVVRRVA